VAGAGSWSNCTVLLERGALNLKATLEIIQIIVSISLIVLVLLQGKSGGLGSMFGGDGGVYKTRRGVEKVLFQATIGLAGIFFLMSLVIIIL
jgi:preprotein translocase subunit SecG